MPTCFFFNNRIVHGLLVIGVLTISYVVSFRSVCIYPMVIANLVFSLLYDEREGPSRCFSKPPRSKDAKIVTLYLFLAINMFTYCICLLSISEGID